LHDPIIDGSGLGRANANHAEELNFEEPGGRLLLGPKSTLGQNSRAHHHDRIIRPGQLG
jgi:hypothetical protein